MNTFGWVLLAVKQYIPRNVGMGNRNDIHGSGMDVNLALL